MTEMLPLQRTRGDTFPIRMVISNDDGSAMDLTGKRVVMTVNREEHPVDTDEQIIQIVGTVIDATGGVVEFEPTLDDAAHVGTFYYDVEVSDYSEMYLWTAGDAAAVDVGDPYPVDGSGGLIAMWLTGNEAPTYQQRDGIDILRVAYDYNSNFRYLCPTGWGGVSMSKDWRISGLAYMDESFWWGAVIGGPGGLDGSAGLYIENEPGYRGVTVFSELPNPTTNILTYYNNTDGYGQTWVSGWVQFVFEWVAGTKTIRGRGWQPPSADPVTWQFSVDDWPFPDDIDPWGVSFAFTNWGGAYAVDVAWLKLEHI